MTTTQPTLNDFFKSKRSARDGLAIKNGKNTTVDLVPKLDCIQASNSTEEPGPRECSVRGHKADIPEVVSVLKLRDVANKSVKKTKTTANKKFLTQSSSQDIAVSFQRVAEKKLTFPDDQLNIQDSTVTQLNAECGSGRKRVREDSSELSDEDTTSSAPTSRPFLPLQQDGTTPVKTNKIIDKYECEAEQLSKRRRTSLAASTIAHTPEAGGVCSDLVLRTTRGSARKKLDMNGTTGFKKDDIAEKPSSVKLSQCSKLSELRSQLLRMQQCEDRVRQFRASAQHAVHEAEQAAMLVTRAKGGIPSPMTTVSPLKAASPRKVFPPHKSLSSPYKLPPSPRHRPPHPQLELFGSLEVVVPVSPCKTPSKSPGKGVVDSSSGGSVPAYQRYQHLLEDESTPSTDADAAVVSSELSLPYHYRLLREVFRAVDTVVSLLHNRREIITYSKLKPAVQQMLRRTFYERHLGQLSRVFPLAYIFRQDKIRPGHDTILSAAGTPNKTGYQLTVTANLNYKQQPNEPLGTARVNLMSRLDDSFVPSNAGSGGVSTGPTASGAGKTTATFRKMDSLVLVERRSHFHTALINVLHQRHAEFLKSLSPPVVVPDPSRIRRWHPQFVLEELPEIEPAPLPQPPHQQQLSTAADVLAASRNLFSHNPRMEAALERAAGKSTTSPSENEPKTSEASISTAENIVGPDESTASLQTNSEGKTALEQRSSAVQQAAQSPAVALALRGISLSLLQKIRARESATASRVMLRSPADTRRLHQLSRLPEVARILRHTLVAERRAALSWEDVLAKLRESHSGMLGTGDLEDHLELLIKEMPDWITKHKLSTGIFIKINKSTDINTVTAKLQALVKQNT